MSTTVVLTASAAENLDGTTGLIPAGSLQWSDATNALAEDALSAFVSFDGTNEKSEFLYVHDFGASLPTELAVEGISVKVLRTGSGDTEDFYIGLVYDDNGIQVTAPSKQQSGKWEDDVDNTANYGGITDPWNKVWDADEINDTTFGFAISAESPSLNDSGSVNFTELTITYHKDIYIDPTGGLGASGTATVQVTYFTPDADGGIIGAGHGGIIFPLITADGGATIGGAASPVHNFYQPVGGITIAGGGNQSQVFDIPDWYVPLEGAQNVPPLPDSTADGGAEIWVQDDDGTTGRVIWRIHHSNLSSPDLLPTKGHIKDAPPGVDGPVVVNLRFFSNQVESPTHGHFTGLDSTQQEEAYNGGWYVQLNSEQHPFGEIRGQIWTYGTSGGGSASVTIIDHVDPTGGTTAGGDSEHGHSFQPTGGATSGGTGVGEDFYTANPTTSGGLTVGGVATVDPFIGDGGSVVSGAADVQLTVTIEPTGGVDVGGTAPAIHQVPVGGGATVGGAAAENRTLSDAVTGGATVGGVALVVPYFEIVGGGVVASGISFIDPYVPTGGASCGGTAVNTEIYDTDLMVNEFEVIARGEFVVPPYVTDETAVGRFFVNAPFNMLHVEISHSMGATLNKAEIRGGLKGTNGGLKFRISDTVPISQSPIVVSYSITDTQVGNILSDRWYFYLQSTTGARVRAQLESITGAKASGSVPQLHFAFPTGGVVAGGIPDVLFTYPIPTSGGATVGGSAESSHNISVGGGATVGGSAPMNNVFIPPLSGGVVCNGLALEDSTFNVITSGGVLCSGPRGIIGIAPKIGGGSTAGGAIGFLWLYNPIILGGGLVNGAARQTFFDQFISVGAVRVGGNSLGEFLRFYVKGIPNQRELAHLSDNILNAVVDDTVKLMPPTDDVSPTLDDGRFRILHNPGWIDVDEDGEEGVLAEVIVKRQKGIVPPKVRKNTERDRRVATSTAL